MATFGGMVCDNLSPTPVAVAEIDADRLVIEYGKWVVDAASTDGFHYAGHWGKGTIDPQRTARLWRYAGKDGSVAIYWEWQNEGDPCDNGESVIRLFPNEAAASIAETPAEWERAKAAVAESQLRAAPNIARLSLFLVADRRIGGKSAAEHLHGPGLYILFYNNGKIARVGQAGGRTLAVRLKEYEPQKWGWFVFRWVAVIPIAAEYSESITPLEADLIRTLDPPENDKHRPRR